MSLNKTLGFVLLLSTVALLGACGGDDDGGTADARPSAADAAPGAADAATVRSFNVALTKAAEVPVCSAGGASAMGTATVMVSADNATIGFLIVYSGLSGAATLAHVHSGAAGTMGGPVLTFLTNLDSPILRIFTAADYTAATGAPVDFPSFVTALKAGNAYINIHTAACGAGEIRGQIM